MSKAIWVLHALQVLDFGYGHWNVEVWIAGVRLLLKMGWRHGRVIGPKHIAAAPGKTYNWTLTQCHSTVQATHQIPWFVRTEESFTLSHGIPTLFLICCKTKMTGSLHSVNIPVSIQDVKIFYDYRCSKGGKKGNDGSCTRCGLKEGLWCWSSPRISTWVCPDQWGKFSYGRRWSRDWCAKQHSCMVLSASPIYHHSHLFRKKMMAYGPAQGRI